MMFLFKDETIVEKIRISDAAEAVSVSSATIRNWIKTGLLDSPTRGYVSIKSLQLVRQNLIGNSKLVSRANKSGKHQDIHELSEFAISKELDKEIRDDTTGLKYEKSLTEAYRNKEGIYYTDKNIVADMLRSIKPSSQTTFLDPCCGCGNFILEAIALGVSVENVYGFDTDPIAVEITKRRIFDKTGKHSKNIFCADFLTIAKNLELKFDFIYTNPPWGKKLAKSDKEKFSRLYETGKSTDSCSLFVFASIKLLTKGGRLGFLLPESVLNIANFQSLRELFLSLSILEIKNYGKPFDGIQSNAYSIVVENILFSKGHQIRCVEKKVHFRTQDSFLNNPNQILNTWTTSEEQVVVNLLFSLSHCSLKDNADWGLGIVTGDNKSKCKHQFEEGLVPVFRGKDINRDKLNPPSIYIDPNLSKYQQTAPPKIYYANKKIIYRFICDCLVFFCDTKKVLILNSANALVLRENFPLSSEQLVSLLNSRIVNWLFKKVFKTHKILRKDLEALPLFINSYVGDVFAEEFFLSEHKIIYNNGTFSVKG